MQLLCTSPVWCAYGPIKLKNHRKSPGIYNPQITTHYGNCHVATPYRNGRQSAEKARAQDSCVSSSHCGCVCFITTQQTGLKDRGHAVRLSNTQGSAVKESHQ